MFALILWQLLELAFESFSGGDAGGGVVRMCRLLCVVGSMKNDDDLKKNNIFGAMLMY